MNKLFTFMCLVLLTATIWAQSPEKLSYQAVVRDVGNSLVIDKPVGAKMSIVQGSENGNTVYSEIFNPNPKTNLNGLLTLEIGGGIPVLGTFSEIDWSQGPYFIRTELDPNGGTDYTITGTSQLLSVPYALHAQTVENVQELSISGTVLSLSRGGGSVNLPTSGGGDNWGTQNVVSDATLNGTGTPASPLTLADNAVTPSKISDGAVTNNKIANNAVTGSKIAQEGATNGQVLKWNGSTWAAAADETGSGGSNPTGPAGGDLSGTYPNPTIGDNKITASKISDAAVTNNKLANNAVSTDKIANNAVTGAKIAQEGASNGQVLKWNGSTWAASNDENGGLTLPYIGSAEVNGFTFGVFDIENTAESGGGHYAIKGTTRSSDGSAIYGGVLSETPGTGAAVFGETLAPNGTGVAGFSHSFTGSGIGVEGFSRGGSGVYGKAISTTVTNYGVRGESASSSGHGISGLATSTTGVNYGVRGQSASSSGRGVSGLATSTTGTTYGVQGESASSNGRGVLGFATNTTGINYGVQGLSESSSGRGVYGEATSTTGTTYGVQGQSESSNGRGVFGYAKSTTGTTYGVQGESASSTGRGVYGYAKSTTGTTSGVWGESSSSIGNGVYGEASSTTGINFGVQGRTSSSSGRGVFGIASSTTGTTYGVRGESSSSNGRGVYGYATSTTGTTFGVRGVSESSNGRGVQGSALSPTGITSGVRGLVLSPDGFSGHFDGGKFYVGGRIGINTTSPITTLHVRHGTLGQNVPPTEGLRLHNSGSNNNSWTLYTINSNGNLQFYANNTLRGTFSAANGTYTSSSNRWLKTDIAALSENILERVLQLQPVSYRFISHPQSIPTIGFIAEDALLLFPELVETTGENDENLGVNYAAFSAVAIKAIQLQQKKITELEEALTQQTQSLQYQQKQMEALLTDNEQLTKRLEQIESFMASTAEY